MSIKRTNRLTANEIISQRPEHTLVSRYIHMADLEHDKPHSHQWHQVIYPKQGMLRTRAEAKEYYVPSNRAVLIPATTIHESWAISKTEFIGIYLNPDKVSGWSNQCRIIELSPLLRELTNHIAKEMSYSTKPKEEESRLIAVFCDQLAWQKEVTLELVLPQDKRLTQITDCLLLNPANDNALSSWAKKVGASERTISRNFEKETGLTFSKWRQRLKLISSLKYLEQKLPVQQIAYDLGYNSPSAFIHSFKQEFKVTPQKYFS